MRGGNEKEKLFERRVERFGEVDSSEYISFLPLKQNLQTPQPNTKKVLWNLHPFIFLAEDK